MILKQTVECRAAIGAGNYAVADRLLAELRSEVEQIWPAANAVERQSIAAQVLELLTWARRSALVRRSHAERRLRQINRNSAYLGTSSLRNRLVEIDG
jgi:hypothetical protein